MAQEIVMLHGANAGAWCFERFRAVFEALGWTCHTPDLVGHGKDAAAGQEKIASLGMADYRAQLHPLLTSFSTPPVILGHSMGAVLAQQLAAEGLARTLILVSPAPRAGILPASDGEKQLGRDLMTLGPFWTSAIPPIFDLAVAYSLNRVRPEQHASIFAQFVPESGRALFELFFWMFDATSATAVNTGAIKCPVLCVSGSDDRLVSLATARATASPFKGATFYEATGHGHMLLLEPGAEDLAARIAEWINLHE
jgi:pimeloyl-ACP methyl ester carboxylesterase